MKINFLLAFVLLLFTFITAKASSTDSRRDDKEYFRSFRKNEQPQNKNFILLNQISEAQGSTFYVIYKENTKGEGFYFKVVLDKDEKPMATYYANEENKPLPITTLEYLKKILSKSSNVAILIEETRTQLIKDCHRKNGCYDKPTDIGVLLCSLDCELSCV